MANATVQLFEEAELEDIGPASVAFRGSIPIPGVRDVPEYEDEASQVKGFSRPGNHKYVTFLSKDEMDLFVEYELDDQDEAFLKEELKDSNVDEHKFELILDWLEKESFKRVRLLALLVSPSQTHFSCSRLRL